MRRLLLTLVSLLGFVAVATAQSVQFADGRVLLATVESADGDGLRVRRLDNGGHLDLRWDHLSSASAQRWKRAFGLVEVDDEVPLVRADEVEYALKGTRSTLIGRIVDPNADPIVVRVKGVDWPVPRTDLRGSGVRRVEVPATQIFTKEEFYAQRLAELASADSADAHTALAQELIAFRDYDRALEHLEKAQKLGNSLDPKKLEQLVARVQRYKEAAKEIGLLEDLRAARSRGKLPDFEKGRAVIADFEKRFPQSKIKSDFDREKQRFEAARTRYLTQQVADQWRRSIQILADKLVTDDAFTLQLAREHAENRMTDAIVDRLNSVMRLEEGEIKTLWADRAKVPMGKRTEHFSYGVGSWLLGEQGVLKDTKVGERTTAQAAPTNSTDPNIERYARMLRQAYERKRNAQGGGGESREQTEEGWWADATRAERSTWLRAYYAEFGGQLVVEFAAVSPCISCFGEGSTPVMVDGQLSRANCFLCQGTKWVRSFKAY